jgi:hypothetical protein
MRFVFPLFGFEKNCSKGGKKTSPVAPLWAGHGTPSIIPAHLHTMLHNAIPLDD